MKKLYVPALACALALVACGGLPGAPRSLPELTAAPLTTDETLSLVHPVELQPDSPPSDPKSLTALLAEGWGTTKVGAGQAVASHTVDGSAAPVPSTAPALLTRFVHLADTQLADDESPSRVVDFDTPGSTYGAFRPQESWMCRVLNAAVRTVNKVHESKPIDFVILGGDNADNAQKNEVEWFLSILGGSPSVKCDSGDVDDPVQGPGNDAKDAFIADGLAMPWRWVTGNHDVLNQGNFPVAAKAGGYLGTTDDAGSRTWKKPNLPTIHDGIVADPKREAMDRVSLMQAVAADGDGHGIGAASTMSGKAFYHFDVGTSLRIVVLDTAAETGGADGVLHRADLMSSIRPALEEAEAQRRYSILVSHHGPTTLSNGGDLGGTLQADAVLTDEWRTFLEGYPHVMLHLGAHTHLFRVATAGTAATHQFFEAETASLADWPGELRLFEIWEHDQFIEIRGVPIDFSDEGDPLVTEARRRQAADFTSGWVDMTVGPGPADARAVSLWFPKVN